MAIRRAEDHQAAGAQRLFRPHGSAKAEIGANSPVVDAQHARPSISRAILPCRFCIEFSTLHGDKYRRSSWREHFFMAFRRGVGDALAIIGIAAMLRLAGRAPRSVRVLMPPKQTA